MATRKGSSKRPQRQHKQSKKSRHDKRVRPKRRNTSRRKTAEAKVPLTGTMQTAVLALQAVMDRRITFRLTIIVAGMLLADDRHTASVWFYDCLISIGRMSAKLAPGSRILRGLDDSPTTRYGKHVEGAGVHHNPTPGPADGEWIYEHNWVMLAWLATHPVWGLIALPLWSFPEKSSNPVKHGWMSTRNRGNCCPACSGR